jgi:hypothetical protein
MDMTLYALLMKELEGQESCPSWTGYKIEVVDELPDIQIRNTIYLIKSSIVKKEITFIQTSSGVELVTKDGKNLILK